ncbi:C-type lectin domain family 4 member A [Pteropus alecto]|uniref:C-type lectin domain family 4 member A n=1 Tax=Pteropus alecto TaxID=9402 RepID=L5KFI2_PTEAL|nr:C-type lectin domain family 4 member A [Pteropus alecto]
MRVAPPSFELCLRASVLYLDLFCASVNNKIYPKDFISKKLDKKAAYYMGLSDPEGTRDWQWVDQTPYNKSATFWHQGEPSSPDERCVILNARSSKWGWNDVPCEPLQRSICKMMKIFI